MAIISIEKINVYSNGIKTKKITNKVILKCDECYKEYEPQYYSKNRIHTMKHHFCSIECSKKSHSNGILRETFKQTCLDKYGATSFAASEIGREKLNEACLEKFGHISAFTDNEVKEKIKKTNLERYGRETYVGSEDHQSKIDYKEISEKSWKTKIANGTCSKSKPEERMYKILISYYGEENIKRQVSIIRQWIDFEIISSNFYLQVDGVYWHGLNRPIEKIELQLTTQDIKIYKQILRDRKLNEYMKEHELKIIRITDDEINERTDEEILSLIKGRL